MTHHLSRSSRDRHRPIRIVLLAVSALAAACGGGDGDTIADAGVDAIGPIVTDRCNTALQDCPAGYKCTYALHGVEGRACRPIAGTRQAGEACTGSWGDDDCDRGLFCEEGLQVCVRFCDRASHCASDEDCVDYRTTRTGVCRTRCTPFDDASCPAGTTCRFERVYGASLAYTTSCRWSGTVPTDEPCDERAPCAPDHTCFGGLCFPHCDDEHPCEDERETCTPPQETLHPNPTHAGTCWTTGQKPSDVGLAIE